MYLVAIHGWQAEQPALAEGLAAALGVLLFEARQRLIGDGPAVVACLADAQAAAALATRLRQGGLAALVIDSVAVRAAIPANEVRRFALREQSLQVALGGGATHVIGYAEMELLLVATVGNWQATTTTVTERKFSLGKTLLAGGVPMTQKVKSQATLTSEAREEQLWIYAGRRPPLLFSQRGLSYDGLGPAMRLTGEHNFACLKSELRRLASAARFDDRLLKRAGQIRLLGPALDPEANLDLALEILARSLGPRPQPTD